VAVEAPLDASFPASFRATFSASFPASPVRDERLKGSVIAVRGRYVGGRGGPRVGRSTDALRPVQALPPALPPTFLPAAGSAEKVDGCCVGE